MTIVGRGAPPILGGAEARTMPDAPDEREVTPPAGATLDALEVGGQTLMVISFPAPDEPVDMLAGLSDAEREVARLAAGGRTNTEIAEARGTSPRTVANQMAAVLHKLGVDSRRALMVRYVRGGTPSAEHRPRAAPDEDS